MYTKFCCVHSASALAKQQFNIIKQQVSNFYSAKEADVIIVLGGDGFLLKMLHKYCLLNKPIYGVNCGTVGFMLNPLFSNTCNVTQIINHAVKNTIYPLQAQFVDINNVTRYALAFNEIYLLRSAHYAAHLEISSSKTNIINKLIGDGVLIATPSGSTAYNRACGGQILDLNSNSLALTSINTFNPINYKGTTVPDSLTININVLKPNYRSVKLFSDFLELGKVQKVKVILNKHLPVTLLFNPINTLNNKILTIQQQSNNV